jgi:hypothetical protein
MSDTVIRRAARALNPDRPLRAFADKVHRPRSTVKSWITGRRRPSIVTLKILRAMLNDRQSTLFDLIRELDNVIAKREFQPRHRTGFNEIRERDGPGSVPRDGRNRLGRPRNAW